MRGNVFEMQAVADRLGQCEVSTSARNWDTLHNAVIIASASAPTRMMAAVFQRGHHSLDDAFNAATPDPMEADEPDFVCTVTLPGAFFLPLVSCIDYVLRMESEGRVELIGPDGSADMLMAHLRGARESFREYLRLRNVGAEILFEE